MDWLKISLFVSSLVALTYCNVTYDQKLILHKCAENKAVDSDYVPRGHVINIGNLPVYEAPDHNDSRRMLIAIYDIFGFSHPNMMQITDHMGLQGDGFRSVLPDVFRGRYWTAPTPEFPNLAAWLQYVGDWDTIIRPDLINIISHYRSQGVEEFAIYGMCWGGAIASFSAMELYHDFKASALVHPSLITNDQAYYVRTPMYLMPSRDEPDMIPFYQVLRANFGDDSGHIRFDDFHGFAGARGNFSDPVNQSHVNEVIRTLGAFFGRLLDGTAVH